MMYTQNTVMGLPATSQSTVHTPSDVSHSLPGPDKHVSRKLVVLDAICTLSPKKHLLALDTNVGRSSKLSGGWGATNGGMNTVQNVSRPQKIWYTEIQAAKHGEPVVRHACTRGNIELR